MSSLHVFFLLFSFFFNDTATTEIYTLSLHDALPIFERRRREEEEDEEDRQRRERDPFRRRDVREDRKSTRLNSSHPSISYAVFCLKKKKKNVHHTSTTRIHNDSLSATPYTVLTSAVM